ncbi:LysR family transcriptional regulator [Pararhizobium sp.]|uniref:LysR family transcriptional regulator n=1 Tax=Pararhizobium sp. TaxID=1977563 RepID=UPI003BAC4FBA
MKDISWDAYQIFLAVARHGGLTGAAQVNGLSPATVGRRVLDLEQGIGRQLFVRSQTGYRLTADGQALFEQLQAMDAVVRKVDGWRQEAHGASVVRLMAGTWVTWLVCENIQAIWSERDGFRLDMSVSERRATLAHRQSDVGVRAVVPDEPHLTSRHTGEVAYAAYRQRNAQPGLASAWIAVSEEDAISPYLRFPHEQAAAPVAVIVSRPRSLLDLARAGAGQAVLPCFVGDLDPGLERAGEELKQLRHGQWIVTNSEDRHRREIRTVSERLFRLVKSHADLFAGKRPSRSL